MNDDLYGKGLTVRKKVLGDSYVENSIANADSFTEPLQRLATEYCWGAVWTRDGLSLKMRSLLNVAMIAALNRHNEFKLHVRGALRNGCTEEEIREVLLQATIYCGMPAGAEAFRLAREVLAEPRT
ncbi:MAG: carboxymuconolactone decarboxylase family protein [Pseudaminobacter sp.]